MQLSIKFSILLLTVLLSSCGGIPVTTDYSSDHDFSSVKSYAWLEPKQKLIIDPLVDNDLMTRRIRDAIDRQMAAKGILLTASDADVFVSFHVGTKEKLSISNYHSHFGYYPHYGYPYTGGYGYGGTGVDVRQYTAGSFVVDIIDPGSRHLLWRGISERRLQESGTPQQRDLFINETIRVILEQFPPHLNMRAQ